VIDFATYLHGHRESRGRELARAGAVHDDGGTRRGDMWRTGLLRALVGPGALPGPCWGDWTRERPPMCLANPPAVRFRRAPFVAAGSGSARQGKVFLSELINATHNDSPGVCP